MCANDNMMVNTVHIFSAWSFKYILLLIYLCYGLMFISRTINIGYIEKHNNADPVYIHFNIYSQLLLDFTVIFIYYGHGTNGKRFLKS